MRASRCNVNAYIEALREFWIAEADLKLALTGKSPGRWRNPTGKQPARDDRADGH